MGQHKRLLNNSHRLLDSKIRGLKSHLHHVIPVFCSAKNSMAQKLLVGGYTRVSSSEGVGEDDRW